MFDNNSPCDAFNNNEMRTNQTPLILADENPATDGVQFYYRFSPDLSSLVNDLSEALKQVIVKDLSTVLQLSAKQQQKFIFSTIDRFTTHFLWQ